MYKPAFFRAGNESMSAHQQLVSVIDSAEGIRRSTKVRMMLLDQLSEGLLDRLLGSILL